MSGIIIFMCLVFHQVTSTVLTEENFKIILNQFKAEIRNDLNQFKTEMKKEISDVITAKLNCEIERQFQIVNLLR